MRKAFESSSRRASTTVEFLFLVAFYGPPLPFFRMPTQRDASQLFIIIYSIQVRRARSIFGFKSNQKIFCIYFTLRMSSCLRNLYHSKASTRERCGSLCISHSATSTCTPLLIQCVVLYSIGGTELQYLLAFWLEGLTCWFWRACRANSFGNFMKF